MSSVPIVAKETFSTTLTRKEPNRVGEVYRLNSSSIENSESTFRSGLIEHLRKLREPEFVMDKIGMLIPITRIEDAIRIIQEWPENITLPEMNEENGEIHFYVYDQNGFCTAGLELHGDGNMCAYSIGFVGHETMGKFDASPLEERKIFFDLLKEMIG